MLYPLPPHRPLDTNNIYQAVISPDREQTQEITAEDGFILREKEKKIVSGKGRKRKTAVLAL